jgi:hypothetical protein
MVIPALETSFLIGFKMLFQKWKVSWGLSHWEIHDNPTTSKIVYDVIQEAFLAKEWNFFHLSWKILNYLHLTDFFKYECKLYLKQSLAPPQCKIIVTYHTSNHETCN